MGSLWLKKVAIFVSILGVLVIIFKSNNMSMMLRQEVEFDLPIDRPYKYNRTASSYEHITNGDMLEIQVPIEEGPCKPTWKSLGENAKRPDWWRTAKIGMWLHWGPQSVGREGDWYAKWIYMPKYAWKKYEHVYSSHVEKYGHPSKHGYKDILPLWKAERWDPDELMKLYHRAGARYVLAQACLRCISLHSAV